MTVVADRNHSVLLSKDLFDAFAKRRSRPRGTGMPKGGIKIEARLSSVSASTEERSSVKLWVGKGRSAAF